MSPDDGIPLRDAIQLFQDRQEYERRHAELREEVKGLGRKVDELDKEVAANKDHYLRLYTEGTAWANKTFQDMQTAFLNEIKGLRKEFTEARQNKGNRWVQAGVAFGCALFAAVLAVLSQILILRLYP